MRLCVCMCVQSPYIDAAVHMQRGLHTHIHTHMGTFQPFFLPFSYRYGGAQNMPLQMGFHQASGGFTKPLYRGHFMKLQGLCTHREGFGKLLGASKIPHTKGFCKAPIYKGLYKRPTQRGPHN